MVIKSSQEVFNENMAKGEEIAKKQGEKSKRIRELREQLSQVVTKSTFAGSESEKQKYASQAQGLKRQIDALQALNE
jgi:nitrate reductase alpha subunit